MFRVIWVMLCVMGVLRLRNCAVLCYGLTLCFMGVILRVRNCVVLCYGLMLCVTRVIIHVSREL